MLIEINCDVKVEANKTPLFQHMSYLYRSLKIKKFISIFNLFDIYNILIFIFDRTN